jgi:hypothetical protein
VTQTRLVLVALLVSVGEPVKPGAQVTLTLNGSRISLSEMDESDVARRLEALIVGCGINAVATDDHSGEPSEWNRARAGSHLYVRFPRPLTTRRGRLAISEVVVGFGDPSFIGPELSMHAGRLIRHGKCDGHRSLALMCAPAVRLHLSPGQAANCQVFDRVGESRNQR